MHQVPNVQVALLFERRIMPEASIQAAIAALFKTEQPGGGQLRLLTHQPGLTTRVSAQDGLTISIEYFEHQADTAAFSQTLRSPVTALTCPGAAARLARHRTHLLIAVSQAPSGATVQPGVGRPSKQEQHTDGALQPFLRRLEAAARVTVLLQAQLSPDLIYWAQSNQLFYPQLFLRACRSKTPGPLHIHPVVLAEAGRAEDDRRLGLRTFGARHFIGREFIAATHETEWTTHLEAALLFLRIALEQNGHLVPHGSAFGPDDDSFKYRVVHRAAEPDGVPLIELQPLFVAKPIFNVPAYAPPGRAFDDFGPSPEREALAGLEREAITERLRQQREAAEGAGGRFEPRRVVLPPEGRGAHRVFGRKRPSP